MSDSNTPSVFTQPRGDDDDVLGHRMHASETPEILRRDEASGVVRQHDEDDVEGHRIASDRVVDKLHQHDDEDDVEGHKKL